MPVGRMIRTHTKQYLPSFCFLRPVVSWFWCPLSSVPSCCHQLSKMQLGVNISPQTEDHLSGSMAQIHLGGMILHALSGNSLSPRRLLWESNERQPTESWERHLLLLWCWLLLFQVHFRLYPLLFLKLIYWYTLIDIMINIHHRELDSVYNTSYFSFSSPFPTLPCILSSPPHLQKFFYFFLFFFLFCFPSAFFLPSYPFHLNIFFLLFNFLIGEWPILFVPCSLFTFRNPCVDLPSSNDPWSKLT